MSTTTITVDGYVGTDVKFETTANGLHVATFRLASTPRRFGRDGSWQTLETNWFSVKVWRNVAENVERSLRRGQPVIVTGRLVSDSWDRPDGTKGTQLTIEATALGHDLTKGTTRFTKARVEECEGVAADDQQTPARTPGEQSDDAAALVAEPAA